MASLTLSTNKYITGRTIAVSGSAFAVSTPVTITVQGPKDAYAKAVVASDVGGAFPGSSFSFVLNAEGKWTISADDGTNQASVELIAWHSG